MNRVVKYAGPMLVALLTLFVLVACGGSNVPANTPAPTSTTASGNGDDAEPTNTRAPRATNTREEADPTNTRAAARATNTRVARATNTPEADDSGNIPDGWETYESTAGSWSISYPPDWTVNDAASTQAAANVQFAAPGNEALAQVTYSDVGAELDADTLVETAMTSFGQSFGSSFTETGRQKQEDGSTRVDFTFEDPSANEFTGSAFIEQRGTGLYILMLISKSDVASNYQDTFEQILSSYKTPAGGPAPGSTDEPEATATTSSSVRRTPTPGDSGSTGETLAIGESGESGNLTLTLNSVRRGEPGLLSPGAGNEYLIVNITVANNTNEVQLVSSLLNFSVQNPEGQEHSQSFATGIETPLDGDVPANGELTGEIGYEVPEGSTGLVLTFEPLFGGGPLKWALDE